MLLVSFSFLFCLCFAIDGANVSTNSTIEAPKTVDIPAKAITSIISDSGVTTQNVNNSTATANVIEKPEAKLVPVGVVPSNKTININDESKEDKKLKSGEVVHTRKVTNTSIFPAVPQQQAPPTIGNVTIVPIDLRASGNATISSTAKPESPKAQILTSSTMPIPVKSTTEATIKSSSVSSSTAKAPTSSPKPSIAISEPQPSLKPNATNTTSAIQIPLKPKITLSVEDDPQLKAISDKTSAKQSRGSSYENNGVPNDPIVLQSSEVIEDEYRGRDYIFPIIGLIFAVPILLVLANIISRRLKNYLSKRNYQRMDYLINEMYN